MANDIGLSPGSKKKKNKRLSFNIDNKRSVSKQFSQVKETNYGSPTKKG
jgi:hypothetical protein